MRAGRRLQRDRVHAGDLDQAALQQVDDLEHALRQRFGPVGMRLGQPLDARHKLVDARVVLHRARAQRIHAQVDGVVPRREPREVADDLDLAQLRQQPRRLAMRIAQQRRGVDCRHIERRQLVSALARRGLLKDQPFVLRLVRTDFADRAWSANSAFVAIIYASTGCAASTFAAVSICLARHYFRRAPQRRILQLRIPAAQLDAADNLLVQQPLAPRRRSLFGLQAQTRGSAARP